MISIRVDDFPHTKGESQHTLGAYKEFHHCLSEGIGGRSYLLGVIPKRCTSDDFAYLRSEPSIIVGMHGTDHDENRLNRNGGNQFESWMTSKQIEDELLASKLLLDNECIHPIWMYMPPRNVLDRRTMLAMENVGFKAYTGGPETDTICREPDLQFDAYVEENCLSLEYFHSEPPHEYGRSDEMLQRGSDKWLSAGIDAVLCLHWTWETNIGLKHLMAFLDAIGKENFHDFK